MTLPERELHGLLELLGEAHHAENRAMFRTKPITVKQGKVTRTSAVVTLKLKPALKKGKAVKLELSAGAATKTVEVKLTVRAAR
jgi:hypothetical protein